MKIPFEKYHGTGNDFILIDGRNRSNPLDQNTIEKLCNRRFGIGADGLIVLSNSNSHDFKMNYFNSNGKEGTMCGNGGRCVTSFAHSLGIINKKARFSAVDGDHESVILQNDKNSWQVDVKLKDVDDITQERNYFLLDTGSPHYVEFVDNINTVDVKSKGQRIRWDKVFQPDGVNVNFVEKKSDHLVVRTFERGVEDVTLSCGTGVTAAAIAASILENKLQSSFNIETLGGNLSVKFRIDENVFTKVWLEGPVVKAFEGFFEI